MSIVLISIYSVLIPISLGVFQINKLNKYLLLLLILVLISGLSDFVVHFNRESRIHAWPIFFTSQFVLLAIISIYNTNNSTKRKILSFSVLIFLVYSLLYNYLLKDISHLFPNLVTITIFSFLIISIHTFAEIYNNIEFENLFTYPFFWINVAILIYFSGNLFLTISYNIFTMDKVFQLYIPIHSTLNTTKNLLFAMAFIVNLYNPRKASLS